MIGASVAKDLLPLHIYAHLLVSIWTLQNCYHNQEFLFVLTGGAGDRLWGFCRRSLLPAPVKNGVRKAATPRYPWALCIISEHPWSSVFFRVCAMNEILVAWRQQSSVTTVLGAT